MKKRKVKKKRKRKKERKKERKKRRKRRGENSFVLLGTTKVLQKKRAD